MRRANGDVREKKNKDSVAWLSKEGFLTNINGKPTIFLCDRVLLL